MGWYTTLKEICTRHSSLTSNTHAEAISKSCRNEFHKFWNTEKMSQRKLSFYNIIKTELQYEEYLSFLPRSLRIHTTRLRISAHSFNCERGRYNKKSGGERLLEKRCRFCMDDDVANTLLHELPFYDPIIEDEMHVLVTCPKYHLPRTKLPPEVLSSFLRHDTKEAFNNKSYLFHIGLYIRNIIEIRNPKKPK